MGSHLPLVFVVAVVCLSSLTGVVYIFVRERQTLKGYGEIESDVLQLKALLSAEVFRDGNDVVLSGTKSKLPVVVRFSYAETTPGLNIRVHGPATVNLAVIPKNSPFIFPANLRQNVGTPDDMFNSRFLTRADESSQARMFLMSGKAMKELQKALCSSRTTLNITHGSLELSETTIPQDTARHVIGHVESLVELSSVLGQMPGAQLAVVDKPLLPKRLLTKTVIVAGAAAALICVIGAARQLGEAPATPQPTGQLSVAERGMGVLAVDAPNIPGLEDFRTVRPSEMDPTVVSWMSTQGVEPAARVPLNLTAGKEDSAVAYLLTNIEGKRRLVILSKSRVLYDARNYGEISIARVPKENIAATQPEPPANTPPPQYNGDGLLLVLDAQTPDKASILYAKGDMITGLQVPDWRQVNIR